jgi:hypothetical protein
MSMSRVFFACALVVVVVFGANRAAVTAETQPREDALLVEVRGLRLAIEQLAVVGARAQVITSRLQLQEQRVNSLISRLAQQRDRIPPVEREMTNLQQRTGELRRDVQMAATPDIKASLEHQFKSAQQDLGQQTAALRRLQGEEADVMNLLATEQARWEELNRQLDQLDATLRR